MFATVLLSAAAAAKCPNAIIDVATHAVPDAALRSCVREHADGLDRFEVKLERADHAVVAVSVATDGNVMAIEEPITLDQLPPPVARAFAARYPKVKPATIMRDTVTGKGLFFELAFDAGGKRHA